MSDPGALPSGRFHAEVGDRLYDLQFESGALTIDGEPVVVDVQWLGPSYLSLLIDGRSVTAEVREEPGGLTQVVVAGRAYSIRVSTETDLLLRRFSAGKVADTAHLEVRAPMPGLVVRVLVAPGDRVQAGDGLVILEAMKMENELRAAGEGTVRAVTVKDGDAVTKNQVLLTFEG